MKDKRRCENCYHHLLNGCKIKSESDYQKVKVFCNKHSYINRKFENLSEREGVN